MTIDLKDVDSRLQQGTGEPVKQSSEPKTLVKVRISQILGDVRRLSRPDTVYSAFLEDFPEVNDRVSLDTLIQELKAPPQNLSNYFTRFEKLAFSVGGRDLGSLWLALLNSSDRSVRKFFDHLGLDCNKEIGRMAVELATRSLDLPELGRLDEFFSGASEPASLYFEFIGYRSSPVPPILELLEISERLQSESLGVDQTTREHFARFGKRLPIDEHKGRFQGRLKNLMVSLNSSLPIAKNTKRVLLWSLTEGLLYIKFVQGISTKKVFKDQENGLLGKDPLSLVEKELSENLGGIVGRIEQAIQAT